MMPPLTVPFFIPHAGCPHDCSFCNQRLITGTGQAGLPEPERIISTLLEWTARSPGRPAEAAFFGGSFTMLPDADQHRVLRAVQPLIDDGLINGVRISTRPDGLDSERLSMLRSYRVSTIEIGVQSLDDTVLEQAHRGHCAEESLSSIARARQAGFAVGAQMLPGLPCDTASSALDSLAGVLDAGASFVRIYPAVALAGTALAERFQSGIWHPWSLGEAVNLCARMLHAAMARGVPVIRIGLQNDECLVAGETVLAGPWHPALGQLVRSELYLALVRKLSLNVDGEISGITCHPARISDVVGHKRRNLALFAGFLANPVQIDADPGLAADEMVLTTLKHKIKGSIITTLNDKEICDAQGVYSFS